MPRKPLPEGFKKAFRGLIAQGWKPKDAMREAWRIYRGDAPGMTHKPLRSNPDYEKQKVIYHAYVANKNLKIYRRKLEGREEFSYSITGGKWNVGTLFSQRVKASQLLHDMLAKVKREHPRSPVRVVLDETAYYNPISHKAALRHAQALVKHEKASVRKNPHTAESAAAARDELARLLSDLPFSNVYVSSLGGVARSSIIATVSWQPRSEWRNGILENSPHGKFHLSHDAKLEQISGYQIKRLRKSTVKSIAEASRKIHALYPASNPGKRYRRAVSERQRRFMGAELGRKRAGKRTVTGMSEKQLREFARKRKRRTRRNPIAVYNPRTKLPMGNVTVSYKRLGGEWANEWFKHPYKTSVNVYGLDNGSVLIQPKKQGTRLWGEA